MIIYFLIKISLGHSLEPSKKKFFNTSNNHVPASSPQLSSRESIPFDASTLLIMKIRSWIKEVSEKFRNSLKEKL